MSIYCYYVYAYIRSKDSKTAKAGTPYYIGKGKGKRAWSKRHKVPLPQDKKFIVMLETGLSELGALALERRYIKWYGRDNINNGVLRNLTDGGDGGDTLSSHPNLKQIMHKRSKIYKSKNRMFWTNGDSCIFSEFPPAPDYFPGFANDRKIINKNNGLKGAKSTSDKIWITNGVHSKMICKSDNIEEGWFHGRTNCFSNKRGKAAGRKHYNDGIKSYMLYEDDPRTKIFSPGRIKFKSQL